MIAVHEADEDFGDDGGADRPELFAAAALFGFFQDVVPKRRVRVEAVLLGHRAVGALGDLVRA